MKRMKFTDRSIAALKHGPDRYWCWEEGRTGLGVRVTAAPSHMKTWQLSTTEIKSFWNNLDTAKMSQGSALALRLVLTTGQRPGEVAAAEWSEIDTTDNVWIMPGTKVKNGKEHRVPLSPLALRILQETKTAIGGQSWVFPSSRTKGEHLSEDSISHAMSRNLEHLGLMDATPHDLRRTAASFMTSMKVPRLVVDKILNHADSSIGGIYDRHTYWQEKMDAAKQWSDRLAIILSEDETIVELTA